jgi:hypothetical protein
MAELARWIKGRMIVSVNDIPEMKTAFKGLSMRRLSTRYRVGGDQHPKSSEGVVDLEMVGRQIQTQAKAANDTNPLGSKYSCSFPMVISEQATYTFFTIN